MHISQNSSAFCDVRCVIARAAKIENGRSRREAFDGCRCPLRANGGSPCSAGRCRRDDHRILSWQGAQVWRQLLLVVSLRQRCWPNPILPDAPLSPNMRKQM